MRLGTPIRSHTIEEYSVVWCPCEHWQLDWTRSVSMQFVQVIAGPSPAPGEAYFQFNASIWIATLIDIIAEHMETCPGYAPE